MRMAEENWKVLTSLFPAGWQQMPWQSGAVERLRRLSHGDPTCLKIADEAEGDYGNQ
jgi:hypothetical protein